MRCAERPDDFASRRAHLSAMSDADLHTYFWTLIEQIVDPLVDEARRHTTPSIERAVLHRMGFSSVEAKDLVARFGERGLLGRGAGRLVLQLAQAKGIPVRDAGIGLLAGRDWESLGR